MLKWTLTTVFAAWVLILSSATFAYTKIYTQESEIETYSDGVTYQNIRIFTNEGWINMNVMRVDLDQDVKMRVLTDTYLLNRDTLTNIVKKNNTQSTIVGAINTDFFDTNSSSAMGNIVIDSQIVSTSVGIADFASFNISSRGVPYVGYINTPTNTFTNGTYTKNITYINKPYLNYSRTIYYDTHFAKQSYGKNIGQDVLELLVVDNIITEIRRKGEPFTIPENGYVLASVGQDIGEVQKNFKVGDTLTIDYDVNLKFMELSTGGGAKLVENGKIVSTFSQNITGKHPRTALGISKDRKELILLTVDGRTTSYRGVTQTELAQLLIDLGAFEAINFDGGGSTQMVAKAPWNSQITTVNRPSDGSERKIYTALAIEKILKDVPELRTVKISLGSKLLMVGSELTMKLLGSDTNYNLTSIKQDEVTWLVSGVEGEVIDGKFIPSKAGKGTITAMYKDFSVTEDFEVKEGAVRLIATPTSIKADKGQEVALKYSVLTEEGDTISISTRAVQIDVPANLGTYNAEKGTFIAGNQVVEGYITSSYKGLTTHTAVGIGIDKVLLYDFETPTGSFTSYPASVTGSYTETEIGARTGKSGILTYDFTQSTDTRAVYLHMTTPKVLPKNTTAIGMWVFGDGGNNHWLRARIVDEKGTFTNLTFTNTVNWTGWKYVTAAIPSGLEGELKLDRIYLAETDATKLDVGYIMFDQIEAVTGQAITITLPADVTKVKTMADYKLPSELKSDFMFFTFYSKKTSAIDNFMKKYPVTWSQSTGQFSITETSRAWLVKIDNRNASIRTNDATQWTKLLKFTKDFNSKKPVIITLNDVYLFNDSLEKALFVEQMQLLRAAGVEVAVVMPTNNKTFSMNKEGGIHLIRVPFAGDEMRYLKLGILNGKIYFNGL